MTNEEIIEYQRQRKIFADTEIGKLFGAYRSATQRYWQMDGNDNVSDKRLHEASEAERKAEDAFVARLMADYGLI